MNNEVSPSNKERVSVLIVDDTPANRLAFSAALSALPIDVVVAGSGPEALACVAAREFAVILLDVRMPLMDGFQTAELIRARESSRYTPIVFTSAHDMTPAQVSRAYVAGATDYVPSPVDAEILTFKVAAFVVLHLRNEAARKALDELSATCRALQADLAAGDGMNQGLRQRIASLQPTLERLQIQLGRG